MWDVARVHRDLLAKEEVTAKGMRMTHDVAIIGGGIVGLATAIELRRAPPARRVVVLEKPRPTSPGTRPGTTAASSTPASTTSPAR